MKNILFLSTILVLTTTAVAAQDRKLPDAFTLPVHPRILLLKGEEASIQKAVTSSAIWKRCTQPS